jgi:hypothetical protein
VATCGTVPPPGKKRLVGADATHAWLSVWCARDVWLDFDPTKGTRQFHDGEWYYFDKLVCRTKFNVSPARYLAGKAE